MNDYSYLGVIEMEFSTITLEKLERRATLTLNRPQAMNAMDDIMMRELAECFEALQQEKRYSGACYSWRRKGLFCGW